MSAAVLTDVQLLTGAMELGQFSGKFDVAESVNMVPTPNFAGRGYAIVVPGLFSATANIDGYADYASGAVSATFGSSSAGSQQAFSIYPNGSATVAGDAATIMRGRLNKMQMYGGQVGDAAAFSLNLTSDAPACEGLVLAPLASRATAGLTGTAVALTGPSATQWLYAALHVTAAAGTNLVVKVQSDDNSGFTSATDRITFSTVSATGWQWGAVQGNLSTETYWRVTATIASSTFTFACAVGVL